MAPMSNGDLGHHPEKMLPPPEAPDIQVDQEFIVWNKSYTIFRWKLVWKPWLNWPQYFSDNKTHAEDLQYYFSSDLLFGMLTPLPPQTFLTSNKERVDDDPDANPYDDLRHYAYEVGFNFNKIRSLLCSNLNRHFPGWWQFRGLVIVAEFRHRWCRPWVWIPPQFWA